MEIYNIKTMDTTIFLLVTMLALLLGISIAFLLLYICRGNKLKTELKELYEMTKQGFKDLFKISLLFICIGYFCFLFYCFYEVSKSLINFLF